MVMVMYMYISYFLVLNCIVNLTWAFNPCVLRSTESFEWPRGTVKLGPIQLPPKGPYSVSSGLINHIPGLTMGAPYNAVIVYPKPRKEGEKFPFLSFAHGTGAGDVYGDYSIALNTVASYGFVIVGARSCPEIECATRFVHDQLQVISACSNDTKLHPALATVNFSDVGVFGHSMGGMSTLAAAGGGLDIDPSKYNIKAAVSQHPCQDGLDNGKGVKVPIMFTAGSVDKICHDGCSERFYNAVPSKYPKILFDLKGVNHFEPTNIGDNSELEAVALFLTCHLRNENCDIVYGKSGKEICSQIPATHTMFNCTVSNP